MLLTSLNLNPFKISACTYVCAAISLRLLACLPDVRIGESILCYRILSFNYKHEKKLSYKSGTIAFNLVFGFERNLGWSYIG